MAETATSKAPVKVASTVCMVGSAIRMQNVCTMTPRETSSPPAHATQFLNQHEGSGQHQTTTLLPMRASPASTTARSPSDKRCARG